MVNLIQFTDISGASAKGAGSKEWIGLTKYTRIDYYEIREGEYSINCDLDPKCDGWLLTCNLDVIMN